MRSQFFTRSGHHIQTVAPDGARFRLTDPESRTGDRTWDHRRSPTHWPVLGRISPSPRQPHPVALQAYESVQRRIFQRPVDRCASIDLRTHMVRPCGCVARRQHRCSAPERFTDRGGPAFCRDHPAARRYRCCGTAWPSHSSNRTSPSRASPAGISERSPSSAPKYRACGSTTTSRGSLRAARP